MIALITFLVYVLIAVVVLWAIQLLLGMIAIPAQAKTLILVIVALVVLVWILHQMGLFL